MEPLFGFLLYFVATLIVSVVASKRGRSGWLVFIICIVAGFGLVVLASSVGGSGVAAGFAAFMAPAGALMWALSSDTSERIAVVKGEHGEFKKCPFCAESVRKEAVKCKHCGSELTSGARTAT